MSSKIDTSEHADVKRQINAENETYSSDFSLNISGHVYEIKSVTSDTFDSFVKNHPNTDVCQLTSWAKVKSPAWISEHIALFCDDKMVAAASLLFRKIPMTPWSLCYSPRGFLVDFDNPSDVEAIVKACIHVAKKHRAFEIKIDPNIERTQGKTAITRLKENGFIHKGFTMGIVDSQPRFAMITNIDRSLYDVLNSFEKETKRLVGRSQKFELCIEECGIDKLDVFSNIMEITGKRDRFFIRDNDYFEKILNYFSGDAELFLVSTTYENLYALKMREKSELKKSKDKLNLKLNTLMSKIEDLNSEVSDHEKLSSLERKTKNIKKELDIIDKKILDNDAVTNGDVSNKVKNGFGNEKIYLSGALMVYCGSIAYYMYAASIDEYRELFPNYFMQWELMKIAKERGCKFYDFGGVSGYTDEEDLKNDAAAGLYYFKKTFGTVLFERVGEFDLVINPFVKQLFNTAMKMRKTLLSLKK